MTDPQEHDLWNTRRRRFRSSPEDVVASLRRFASDIPEQERTLTNYKRWAQERGEISGDVVYQMLGPWPQACEMAKIDHAGKINRWNDDELLDNLEKVWRWKGQPPAQADLKKFRSQFPKDRTPSPDVYTNRYGSWRRILSLFGEYKRGVYTKDQLLEHLVERSKPSPHRRLSKKMRYEVLARDGGTCVLCRSQDKRLEVDHIVPLAQGGSDAIENLQTLCIDCNRGKSDRDDRDFRSQS